MDTGTTGEVKMPSKLKQMITKRKLTLDKLSKLITKQNPGYVLGVDRLSRYSNQGSGLNIQMLVAVRIAKALKCSLDDICDLM